MLQNDPSLKARFIKLIIENIRFVDSFHDPLITPDFLRMYHRKKSVNAALNEFIDDIINVLDNEDLDFTVAVSKDMQKVSDSRTDLSLTEEVSVVKMLDQKVREPRRLLFYSGALFEATVNTADYSQSQTMIMLEVPTEEDIENKRPLSLLAAPADDGLIDQLFDFRNPPSEDLLLSKKWKKVKVNISGERLVSRNNVSACRRQYTLRHVGASTVSSSVMFLHYQRTSRTNSLACLFISR